MDYDTTRERIKAKYIPRRPKGDEVLIRVGRPQLAPATAGGLDRGFAVYARGDLFTRGIGYVVVAAKPGCTARGLYGKKWHQYVIVRPATTADHDSAVQVQQPEWVEAQDALHSMDRL